MTQQETSNDVPLTKREIRLQIVEAEEACDALAGGLKEKLKEDLQRIRTKCKLTVYRLKKELASASEETQSAG